MPSLIDDLYKIVGPAGFIGAEDICSRSASLLDSNPHQAIALMRPKTAHELSAIMKLCHEAGQPVVIQGGMTGLVEGATSRKNELAISLERMNAIINTDVIGQSITLEAGVTIQSLQEASKAKGLLFPVDWGARGSAMVGGAIATNAGGNSVIRYGMMREQVLGLEVVLADGTILSSMNRLIKNNAGFDLKQLFIGSEGTLGVITKAVLRLRPDVKYMQTALIGLESFDAVIAVYETAQSNLAGALSAFEVMWQAHYEMIVTEGGHQWVLPNDYAYYAILEMSGGDESADSEGFQKTLADLMERGSIVDAVICMTQTQRDAVWAIREDVDTFLRVLHPPIPFDVSVPITDVPAYVEKVFADMEEKIPKARGTVFGHLGDNNIHFCWTTGNDNLAEIDQVKKIVYENLTAFNGSISAEHGIGVSKRSYLNLSRNSEEIAWMKRIKQLFDPHNILNPGRVIDIIPSD